MKIIGDTCIISDVRDDGTSFLQLEHLYKLSRSNSSSEQISVRASIRLEHEKIGIVQTICQSSLADSSEQTLHFVTDCILKPNICCIGVIAGLISVYDSI
jgi:hypothetical protein